jgi:hypothetical protein
MPDHYSRIFLLSHMRAFTSLAGHILGSHPGINGYFEMHISYDDASALDKQLDMFLQFETPKKNSRYLFDKLLHNDYRLNTGLFEPAGLKLLVALMEPEKTVKSIVDLFQQKGTEALYASPLEAANYYIERIRVLADFCRTTDQPYYYYDAELFQEAPDRLLGKLTDWLELASPLTGRYQLFSQTGKAGKGDSSRFIYSGKIEKTRVAYSHIKVPENILSRARESYRDCRSSIIANAADSMLLPRDRVRS